MRAWPPIGIVLEWSRIWGRESPVKKSESREFHFPLPALFLGAPCGVFLNWGPSFGGSRRPGDILLSLWGLGLLIQALWVGNPLGLRLF